MTWTLCTSEAIIYKAGNNASSEAISSGSIMADFYDEAEGVVVAETRRDWVGGYSSVASGAKFALADAVSDLAAMKVINYDPNEWTLATAQTKLDVLRDNATRNINTLKDFKSNGIKEV